MNTLPRVTPREAGVDSRGIIAFLDSMAREGVDLHAFMLLRHGCVAAEGYWTPYAPEKTHVLYSASKSFTAMAVGFAADDGLLSVNDLVTRFFPEQPTRDICENMRRVTVEHLLTMTVGFDEDPHDFPFEGRTDWLRNFLTAYVPNEPGTVFCYSTHASYMLSAIVQRVTGRTVWDYLSEKLFRPLGFEGEYWEESPAGISVGGWGLMLRPEDFAKFGQFLLNKGVWQGKRLLSADFIERAGSVLADNSAHPSGNPKDALEFHSGYGYQLWHGRKGSAFFASGGFGQYSFVIPEKDAVVMLMSGTHNDHVLSSIWEYLAPAMSDALPSDAPENDSALSACLNKLCIPFPEGTADIPAGFSGNRVRYTLSPRRYGFTAVTADFTKDVPAVCFEMPEALAGNPWLGNLAAIDRSGGKTVSFTVNAGYGSWLSGRTCVDTCDTDTDYNTVYEHVSCAAAWSGHIWELRMVYDHAPFWDIFRFEFGKERLIIRCRRNVWHYGEYIDEAIIGYPTEEVFIR